MSDLRDIQFVTFDCAQTLVDVRWNPAVLAVESAQAVGLEFDPAEGAALYQSLLNSGWPLFRELNLTRCQATCDAFWMRLTEDWVVGLGLPAESAGPLYDEAERRLFETGDVFRLFPDVQATLEGLLARGFRLGVISNWDISLHRVLRMLNLTRYFEVVIASLEEGIEKPEPQIFQIALRRLGANPGETLHVGDHPLDDLHGARQMGMRALLIDRKQSEAGGVIMNRLTDLLDRLPPG